MGGRRHLLPQFPLLLLRFDLSFYFGVWNGKNLFQGVFKVLVFIGSFAATLPGCAYARHDFPTITRGGNGGSVPKSEQEWREIGNQVLDNLEHSRERFDNRLALENNRFSQDYIEGKLQILLRLHFVVDGDDIIAHIKNISTGERDVERILHPEAWTCESSSNQESVFVHDVEVVDCPERVIPSLVRLYAANSILDGRTKVLYFSLEKLRFFFLGLEFGRVEYRECGFGAGLAPADFCELPRQMIQGATQIVDGIAGDNGDNGRSRISFLYEKSRSIRQLRVILGRNFIRLPVEKLGDFRFQVTDVLLGPFNFLGNSKNPIDRHDFNNLAPFG